MQTIMVIRLTISSWCDKVYIRCHRGLASNRMQRACGAAGGQLACPKPENETSTGCFLAPSVSCQV